MPHCAHTQAYEHSSTLAPGGQSRPFSMSQLEQHLRAWSLDAVEACLLDAGIELIQDAMELTRDDLENIGLSTAQAIALRHSFGFADEHAATVAEAVASVAASGMEVQSSASAPAGHPSSSSP